MKAKKVAIEEVAPAGRPAGSGRRRLTLPEAQPSQVNVLGKGADAAAAVVDLFEKLGVTR
jgi:electron transfer flavoprotein beta subunit